MSGHDVVAKMRSAAADPSPLTRLIADPAIVELAKLKKHGKYGMKGSKKVPSIRRLAIEEEECELGRLKAILRCAADHLERAAQRVGESEALARYAEKQEKEALVKLTAAEVVKTRMETELRESIADSQRYQLELQSADEKLQHLESDLRRAERLKDEYEKATVKAEEQRRQYKNKLLDYKMRKNAIEHGHWIELLNTLDEGREEGWVEGEKDGLKEGRAQGYQEGKNIGRLEGLKEGRAKGYVEGKNVGKGEGLKEGYMQGRADERQTAFEAFDRFLDEEMDSQDDKWSSRIRKWTESVYHSGSVKSAPSRPPSPGV
ncbi:hypothetical protein H0H87_000700 [Tephrocybe sp. NHM501043]|nr:hypothetical protein H0H87_000700 [Tephrocybe sp. NHM501043]